MALIISKSSNLIDNLIYVFSLLFLLTLTNSIFLNQVGYFGTLLVLFLKYYLEKKNPFFKSGLEWAFLFFFIAEILSTIFSVDQPTAIQNMLKRFFLIPTLYAFIAAPKDFKTAKQFVFIYLGAALLTMIYYLVRSYDYFINNLYQIEGSGPSLFQYPITSSELMTFSLVILFAFLVNEKSGIKNKLIVLLFFTINLLALIATFKRTGWIGAAAGIFMVIILSRRWFILIIVAVVVLVLVFMNKNVSQIQVYYYNKSGLEELITLKTEGRALNVFVENDSSYISDFENGLITFKDSILIHKYNLPSPIIDFNKWSDKFYLASLMDTRFVILRKNSFNNLETHSELFTQNTPISYKLKNNFFYVLDDSSQLTVFRNPTDFINKKVFDFRALPNLKKIFIDSNYCVMFSDEKVVYIYLLKNYLPDRLILSEKLTNDVDLIGMNDNRLFLNSKIGLKVYSIEDGKLILRESNNQLKDIIHIYVQDTTFILCNSSGNLFVSRLVNQNHLKIISDFNLGYVPQSINFNNRKLYTTSTKTSRLTSIFDPYYPTNYTRFAFWRAGLKIFNDYPIFGVGDIDLAKLYRIYKRPYDREIQGHLHSNYFHSLTTLGAFGFIAIMFLLINIFFIYRQAQKKLKNVPFASSYSLGAIGGYIGFLVAGLTEYNFGDHEVITLVWFTLAISIAFTKFQKDTAIPKSL